MAETSNDGLDTLRQDFAKRKRPKMSEDAIAELILSFMRDHFRWSLSRLVQVVRRYSDDSRFAKPYAAYTKDVRDTVSQENGYKHFFLTIKDAKPLYDTMANGDIGYCLREELRILQATPAFGSFPIDTTGDLTSTLASGIQTLTDKAPLIVSLVRGATKESRGKGVNTNDWPIDARFVMIAAILGNIYRHNSFEVIQASLGMYLYGNGCRTRAIDTFCKLGISRGSQYTYEKYSAMQDSGRTCIKMFGLSMFDLRIGTLALNPLDF